MVDFDTNALLLRNAGIKVVGASVDSVEDAASIATGMRIGYVQVLGEVDMHAVADATGANIQTGDREFLHATGFILDADGNVADSVYSSGPIGRFSANDVLKIIAFREMMAARAKS